MSVTKLKPSQPRLLEMEIEQNLVRLAELSKQLAMKCRQMKAEILQDKKPVYSYRRFEK